MSANTSTEQSLLRRAKQLDHDALAQIYDLHSPELYRYAARFLGDPCVAEDCVADTFSRFLHAISANRGPKEHLKAYLYRIAHNWIADYYRRTPNPDELKDTHPDKKATPEQEATARIRQASVRKALRQLTPAQRQVIVLKYLEGWKNEEVARLLRKPVGAVKSLQHRALAQLQKILCKENPYER